MVLTMNCTYLHCIMNLSITRGHGICIHHNLLEYFAHQMHVMHTIQPFSIDVIQIMWILCHPFPFRTGVQYSVQKKKVNGSEDAKYFSPVYGGTFFLAQLFNTFSLFLIDLKLLKSEVGVEKKS